MKVMEKINFGESGTLFLKISVVELYITLLFESNPVFQHIF